MRLLTKVGHESEPEHGDDLCERPVNRFGAAAGRGDRAVAASPSGRPPALVVAVSMYCSTTIVCGHPLAMCHAVSSSL